MCYVDVLVHSFTKLIALTVTNSLYDAVSVFQTVTGSDGFYTNLCRLSFLSLRSVDSKQTGGCYAALPTKR